MHYYKEEEYPEEFPKRDYVYDLIDLYNKDISLFNGYLDTALYNTEAYIQYAVFDEANYQVNINVLIDKVKMFIIVTKDKIYPIHTNNDIVNEKGYKISLILLSFFRLVSTDLYEKRYNYYETCKIIHKSLENDKKGHIHKFLQTFFKVGRMLDVPNLNTMRLKIIPNDCESIYFEVNIKIPRKINVDMIFRKGKISMLVYDNKLKSYVNIGIVDNIFAEFYDKLIDHFITEKIF